MEARCMVFFNRIGALAKSTAVGFCFHLVASLSFLLKYPRKIRTQNFNASLGEAQIQGSEMR
jgi:hypothetical protein